MSDGKQVTFQIYVSQGRWYVEAIEVHGVTGHF